MVPKVVVQLVEELKGRMTIGEICRHLGVSRASYYRWKARGTELTKKEIRNQEIGACVRKIDSYMVIEK